MEDPRLSEGQGYYVSKADQVTPKHFFLEHALGVTGTVLAVHPTRDYVAYAAGNVVVLWDWRRDHRTYLQGHVNLVSCAKFVSGGGFLLTADGGVQPTMILWAVEEPIHEIYRATKLPSASRKPVIITSLELSADGQLLMSVEGQPHTGRVCLWQWTPAFSMVLWAPLENDSTCFACRFFPNSLHFATVESGAINFWLVVPEQDKMTCIKRKTMNGGSDSGSVFVDATMSPVGVLLVAIAGGEIAMYDRFGNNLSSFRTQKADLRSLTLGDAHVLIGTGDGTVLLYNTKSMEFEREVPFQFNLRQRRSLGTSRPPTGGAPAVPSADRGPGVRAIQVNSGGEYAFVNFEDSSLAVFHAPNCPVTQYCMAQFGKVTALACDPRTPSVVTSASSDQSVCIWQVRDEPRVQVIDIPTSTHPSLSYMMSLKRPPASEASGRSDDTPLNGKPVAEKVWVTTLEYHPEGRILACGDNHGFIRMFDTQTGAVVAVADSHPRAVANLSFSSAGHVLACCHTDGCVAIFDASGGLRLVGVIEARLRDTRTSERYVSALVVPDDHMLAFGVVPDLRASVLVVTLASPTDLFLHEGTLASSNNGWPIIVEYHLDDVCTGFALHPSGEYLLATCARGSVAIFHVGTGTIRGMVRVDVPAEFCTVDPSGLYVAVATAAVQDAGTKTTLGTEVVSSEGSNPVSRIAVYEILTGRAAADLRNLPVVRTLRWGIDGSRLFIGSDDGVVLVWRVSEAMAKNIRQVQQASSSNPQFWSNFPINFSRSQPTSATGTASPLRRSMVAANAPFTSYPSSNFFERAAPPTSGTATPPRFPSPLARYHDYMAGVHAYAEHALMGSSHRGRVDQLRAMSPVPGSAGLVRVPPFANGPPVIPGRPGPHLGAPIPGALPNMPPQSFSPIPFHAHPRFEHLDAPRHTNSPNRLGQSPHAHLHTQSPIMGNQGPIPVQSAFMHIPQHHSSPLSLPHGFGGSMPVQIPGANPNASSPHAIRQSSSSPIPGGSVAGTPSQNMGQMGGSSSPFPSSLSVPLRFSRTSSPARASSPLPDRSVSPILPIRDPRMTSLYRGHSELRQSDPDLQAMAAGGGLQNDTSILNTLRLRHSDPPTQSPGRGMGTGAGLGMSMGTGTGMGMNVRPPAHRQEDLDISAGMHSDAAETLPADLRAQLLASEDDEEDEDRLRETFLSDMRQVGSYRTGRTSPGQMQGGGAGHQQRSTYVDASPSDSSLSESPPSFDSFSAASKLFDLSQRPISGGGPFPSDGGPSPPAGPVLGARPSSSGSMPQYAGGAGVWSSIRRDERPANTNSPQLRGVVRPTIRSPFMSLSSQDNGELLPLDQFGSRLANLSLGSNSSKNGDGPYTPPRPQPPQPTVIDSAAHQPTDPDSKEPDLSSA